MKRISIHLLLAVIFFSVLIFPGFTILGTTNGLLIWYRNLLPALLPFLLLTNIIIKSNALHTYNRLATPFIGRLFRVSKNGSFAVVTGFLCGYPMGAKVVRELYVTDKISNCEAKYLISFCNNTSPMFLIGYVSLEILGNSDYIFPVFFSVYSSAIITSCITRNFYKVDNNSYQPSNKEQFYFDFSILDDAIINSVEILVKIGGYVMIFSVLLQFFLSFSANFLPELAIFLPLLELTNGLKLCMEFSNSKFRVLYAIFLSSFGGFCSLAQTKSVLTGINIPLGTYFIQKIITAMMAVIIGYITIYYS